MTMTSAEFKAIRCQLGLTQTELASIMAMPQPSIARIESGERQPTKIIGAFLRLIEKHHAKKIEQPAKIANPARKED